VSREGLISIELISYDFVAVKFRVQLQNMNTQLIILFYIPIFEVPYSRKVL
jgi:hypothetical protein